MLQKLDTVIIGKPNEIILEKKLELIKINLLRNMANKLDWKNGKNETLRLFRMV